MNSTARRETDTIGGTHTVRVSCACKTCKANAAKIGHPFPLAAYITSEAAAALGITDANADKSSKTHGTVYLAHDPIVGKWQRTALPVVA